MKKNIINTIIIALALSSSQVICAQQNNVSQHRVINAALNTIDSYSVWATVADAEAHYELQDLFVSKESLVYNDLLGIKQEENLTIEEYANTMLNALRNKKIFVKNIKNEGVISENGQTRIRFSMDKDISYIDSCGTYFSSSEFYKADHHLLFTLIYDNQAQSCKIESITGELDSPNRLNVPFFTFVSEDQRDSLLLYRGKRISFNTYHQALLDGQFSKKYFRYRDPNVSIKPLMNDCNHVSMKYRDRRFRVKAHYNFGLGDAYKLDGVDNSITVDKNASNNFGLDFGYVFPSKGILKTGIFLGLGFAQSQIDLKYANADYAYTTTADVDGDSYIRHYQSLSMKQSMKMTDLTIPVYVDFNFHFSKLVNLFVDLGAKVYMNMGHKVDATEGKAYIYGMYPQYDDMRMDERWGYNGFGDRTYSMSNLDHSDLVDVSGFTVDAFAGAGLRINIPRTPIAIDLGAKYQMGFMNVVKTNSDRVALSETADAYHALVYNTINGTESQEHVRNLTESLSSIKRQQLMLSAGLILKF